MTSVDEQLSVFTTEIPVAELKRRLYSQVRQSTEDCGVLNSAIFVRDLVLGVNTGRQH